MMLHQVLENQRLILQKLNREEEQDYSEMVDALRSPSNSKFELHRLEDKLSSCMEERKKLVRNVKLNVYWCNH